MNRIGVIDGVLSDDVDNFLFGATTVIRKFVGGSLLQTPIQPYFYFDSPSNNLSGNKANPVLNAAGKDDKNHTKVYRLADITAHPEVRLTRGGMILIGLMKGGDYHPGGLARCGPVIAHGLAQCGFGDTLFQAAKNLNREELVIFLVPWRHELRQELLTNSQGYIGKKQPALAKTIPDSFPDIDVLLSYVNPITSETMGKADYYDQLSWGKEPDLGKLAANCELSFEWGYKEAIIKRFRTVIWHAAILRILRRAVLDLDAKAGQPWGLTVTPRKKGAAESEPVGTPSKMIAKYFSSLTLGTLRGYLSDCEDNEDERLIIKIHSSRNHVSTDGILEYRLEIAPAQLVRIAESGIKGLRVPEGPDEWVDDDDDDEGGKKGAKKPPPDPESHMRVWMPACMVRLVEPGLVAEYEAIQAKKLEKKSAKGRPKVAKAKSAAELGPEGSSGDELPVIKPKPACKPAPRVKVTAATSIAVLPQGSPSPEPSMPERVVRDLTKKKLAKPKSISSSDLKSFFATTKSSRSTTGKAISDRHPKPGLPPMSGIHSPKHLRDASSARSTSRTNLERAQHSPHNNGKVRNSNEYPANPSRATTSASSSSRVPFGDDDDLFLSDDPFDAPSHPRIAIHIKQSRKKMSLPSSDSDCSISPVKKSPRKASHHTSPRSQRKASGEIAPDENGRPPIRSCSPSPLRPLIRPKVATSFPPPRVPKHPLRLIEISSDSEDNLPPTRTVFPLAVARARANAQGKPEPVTHKSVGQKKLLLKSAKINVSNDIIDLT